MGSKLEISLKGIEKLQSKIEKLRASLKDMTPVFKDIADLEWSQTKLRFTKQVDPTGKPWPDPITLRRDGDGGRNTAYTLDQAWDYVIKSRFHAAPPGFHFFSKARGDKAMRDTGTLFNSIGRSYGPNSATVGTNLSYAKKLQTGRFPFIGLNERSIRNVESVLNKYMKGLTK